MRNFLALLLSLFIVPMTAYAADPDMAFNSPDPHGRNHSVGIGIGATFSPSMLPIPRDVPLTLDYQYRLVSFYSMGAEATINFKYYEDIPCFNIYWIHAFHLYQSEHFVFSLQAGIGYTYRYVSDEWFGESDHDDESLIVSDQKHGIGLKADVVFAWRVLELLSLKLKIDFHDQIAFDVFYKNYNRKNSVQKGHTHHQFESSIQFMTTFHF